MSEFKTNKISPRSGTTQTIGDSGDSVSTSGGSTITNAGSISTAGITGGTINNTTGSLYLRGEVDWKPGDIKTTSFTATDNQGFFVNTTSGQITITLPSSPSVGDVIGIKDYANTFDTNQCNLNPNGNKIQGSTSNFVINVEGSSIILIYVDSTRGWVITDASKAADISQFATFITASGGTVTTVGDYKFHRFTGPGTFTVCSVGNPVGSTTVDTIVVAGGGGGSWNAGGGGAGGLRDITSIPVTTTGYPISVGGGGSGGTNPSRTGASGSNSVAALSTTYTSAGGGGGGNFGVDGGSGGGSGACCSADPGGAGNTPPVSPPQGNPGGFYNISGYTGQGSTGGGGATTAGGQKNNCEGRPGTAGGAGKDVSSNYPGQPNSSVYAGGGGGGAFSFPPGSPGNNGGTGGAGGGGNGGGPPAAGFAGTTNTGGGGGGGTSGSGGGGANGGSGIVIIRYKFQ
jgi:hypothetical protein